MSEGISVDDALNSTRHFFETEPTTVALKELGKAVAEVLKNERAELANDLLQKDLIPMGLRVKSKGADLKAKGKAFLGFAARVNESIKANGVGFTMGKVTRDAANAAAEMKDSLSEMAMKAAPEARRRVVGFVDKIADDYSALETDEEKAKYIAKLALYTSVFSYGFYQGHALPDSDFKLWGAGAHRSFISHSAVPLLVTATAATLINRLLERAETKLAPGSDAQRWSQTCRTVSMLFTAGFGAGMAFHLVVDGTLHTGGTIRIHDLSGNVIGSLVPGTRIDDMAYTTAMGLFAAEMSNDAMKAV